MRVELRHANRQTDDQTRRSLLALFADYANMSKIGPVKYEA